MYPEVYAGPRRVQSGSAVIRFAEELTVITAPGRRFTVQWILPGDQTQVFGTLVDLVLRLPKARPKGRSVFSGGSADKWGHKATFEVVCDWVDDLSKIVTFQISYNFITNP